MTDSCPPSYPPPGWQPGQFPPGYPQPYPYPDYPDMPAPYGRDPVTGQPLSNKSKVIAALLQLLGLFGFLGFGRIYLGQYGMGIAQLLTGLLASFVTWGFGVVVPIVWGIVEAIRILNGRVYDAQGRPLRER